MPFLMHMGFLGLIVCTDKMNCSTVQVFGEWHDISSGNKLPSFNILKLGLKQ